MKRIIFILWLLSLSISSFAQDHYRRVIRYPSLGFSSFAQSTLKDSLMANPHIEGLIEYAKSLGRPILDPVEGDDFNEIYNAFYRKIAEESNN